MKTLYEQLPSKLRAAAKKQSPHVFTFGDGKSPFKLDLSERIKKLMAQLEKELSNNDVA